MTIRRVHRVCEPQELTVTPPVRLSVAEIAPPPAFWLDRVSDVSKPYARAIARHDQHRRRIMALGAVSARG